MGGERGEGGKGGVEGFALVPIGKETLSLRTSQVAQQAGAHLSSSSRKRPRVFLIPPGWGAGPSMLVHIVELSLLSPSPK